MMANEDPTTCAEWQVLEAVILRQVGRDAVE
jgi:hypothetical protein